MTDCDDNSVDIARFRQFTQRVENLAKEFGVELRERTLPDGGTTNQYLRKTSNTDLAVGWGTIAISHVSGLQTQLNRLDGLDSLVATKANRLVSFGTSKSGASMNMASGDAFLYTDLSHTADAVLNVPSGIAGSNGTPFTYFNNGDYNITIVPDGGVTIKYFATLVISPGQTFQLLKRSTNTYRLIG